MRSLAIIGLSVLAAITCGVIHDQITARICVEYFTVGHPRLIASNSPTILGLFWGVIATWWVGLPLGILLALAARLGKSRPKLAPADLIRPLGRLLLCMAAFAFLGGLIGYVTASTGIFVLVDHLARRIPPPHHVAFLICGWTHGASYLAGIIGGIVLCLRTWIRRGRLEREIGVTH